MSAAFKKLPKDFITGLLLGFLITFYVLFILKPVLMPSPAVAPVKDDYMQSIDR